MNKLWKPIIACVISLLFTSGISAKDKSGPHKVIWDTVVATWETDIVKNDPEWAMKYALPEVQGWGETYPMPRGRDSIVKWSRFGKSEGKGVLFEVKKIGMVVKGNTALVHYYYSIGSKDKDGKNKTDHGRCSDTLMKDKGEWKYLGWNCT